MRRSTDRSGLGFVLWFALIFLVNVAFLGALIYLIVTVAEWIGRQS